MCGGRPALLGATPGVPPPARGPTDRGALGDLSEKRKAGPAGPARARCAHPARTRRAPARLTTCSPRVFRRAERRVFRRAERRVSRRAERRAPGALTARRTARSRRAERRAPGAQNCASLDAQSSVSLGTRIARLPVHRRHASSACEVFDF